MKATGIVRRIDDLGRVVIPKEIRRTLRIREGDPSSKIKTDAKFLQRFFRFFKLSKPHCQKDFANTENQMRFASLILTKTITSQTTYYAQGLKKFFKFFKKRSKSYSVFKVQFNSVRYQ